jgi:dihydroneopterin triphosphate diphosphatase
MINYFDLPIRLEGILYRYTNKSEINSYQFLCLKRSEKDEGFWQPVTGTNQSNESLLQTLNREIVEEAGLNSDDFEIKNMFYQFTWEKRNMVIYEYCYAVHVDSEAIIKLSDEHVEYKWLNLDEAITRYEKQNNKNALKLLSEVVIKL